MIRALREIRGQKDCRTTDFTEGTDKMPFGHNDWLLISTKNASSSPKAASEIMSQHPDAKFNDWKERFLIQPVREPFELA